MKGWYAYQLFNQTTQMNKGSYLIDIYDPPVINIPFDESMINKNKCKIKIKVETKDFNLELRKENKSVNTPKNNPFCIVI